MPENSRDRLIQTAAALFARHGFGPVGLDRIIAEVGVTKTTFYNHFESKDALIVAVLDHQHNVETASLMADVQRIGGDDPRDRIVAIFDVFDVWFQESEFRGCIFMSAANEFPSPNDPIHRAALVHGEHLFRVIRDFSAQAGAADPDALAAQLMIIISGAIATRQTAGHLNAAKFAKAAAEALINAAVAAAPRRRKSTTPA